MEINTAVTYFYVKVNSAFNNTRSKNHGYR